MATHACPPHWQKAGLGLLDPAPLIGLAMVEPAEGMLGPAPPPYVEPGQAGKGLIQLWKGIYLPLVCWEAAG